MLILRRYVVLQVVFFLVICQPYANVIQGVQKVFKNVASLVVVYLVLSTAILIVYDSQSALNVFYLLITKAV